MHGLILCMDPASQLDTHAYVPEEYCTPGMLKHCEAWQSIRPKQKDGCLMRRVVIGGITS